MNVRVLVVDDSSTMRKIIIRSLMAVGVTDVSEAQDGVEALDIFQKQTFDLVLTDWNMPHKTGLELAADIRKIDTKIPIIMITTEAEKERVIEALKTGVNDYLIKPFDKDALRSKLQKVTEPSYSP